MPWTTATIETPRLRLRAFSERDKPVIAQLTTSPEVRRYLGGPTTDPTALAQLEVATVGERAGVFCIADRNTDVALGRCDIEHERRGEAELGYELVPAAWGRGLATEALTTFLDWVWRTHADESLIAVTQTANVPSCRLLDRLGFALEREFEEFGARQSQYRLCCPADATN